MTLLDQLPDTPLSIKEENKLLKTETGRTKVVLHNMLEAFAYAKSVSRSCLPDDAIFSLCYTALDNASRNYKPYKNRAYAKSRFFGYTKPYIRGEIAREWRRANVVANGKHVSLDDFHATRHTIELGENDNGDMDWAGTDEHVEPEFDAIHTRERWALVEPFLHRALTESERMVLDLHYRGSFNFEQIGKLLSISRSAIQNTHARAVKKLRVAIFKDKGLLKRLQ